ADRRRGRGGPGRGRLGRMTETGVAPELVVCPMLRYVDRTDATVWVEVSRPCRVTIRAGGCEAVEDSWGVHGHHFALLHLSGLESGAEIPYQVELDGETVWPLDPDRPSVIRTPRPDTPVRRACASGRRGEGHRPAARRTAG